LANGGAAMLLAEGHGTLAAAALGVALCSQPAQWRTTSRCNQLSALLEDALEVSRSLVRLGAANCAEPQSVMVCAVDDTHTEPGGPPPCRGAARHARRRDAAQRGVAADGSPHPSKHRVDSS
jgi:hypothetical protein